MSSKDNDLSSVEEKNDFPLWTIAIVAVILLVTIFLLSFLLIQIWRKWRRRYKEKRLSSLKIYSNKEELKRDVRDKNVPNGTAAHRETNTTFPKRSLSAITEEDSVKSQQTDNIQQTGQHFQSASQKVNSAYRHQTPPHLDHLESAEVNTTKTEIYYNTEVPAEAKVRNPVANHKYHGEIRRHSPRTENELTDDNITSTEKSFDTNSTTDDVNTDYQFYQNAIRNAAPKIVPKMEIYSMPLKNRTKRYEDFSSQTEHPSNKVLSNGETMESSKTTAHLRRGTYKLKEEKGTQTMNADLKVQQHVQNQAENLSLTRSNRLDSNASIMSFAKDWRPVNEMDYIAESVDELDVNHGPKYPQQINKIEQEEEDLPQSTNLAVNRPVGKKVKQLIGCLGESLAHIYGNVETIPGPNQTYNNYDATLDDNNTVSKVHEPSTMIETSFQHEDGVNNPSQAVMTDTPYSSIHSLNSAIQYQAPNSVQASMHVYNVRTKTNYLRAESPAVGDVMIQPVLKYKSYAVHSEKGTVGFIDDHSDYGGRPEHKIERLNIAFDTEEGYSAQPHRPVIQYNSVSPLINYRTAQSPHVADFSDEIYDTKESSITFL